MAIVLKSAVKRKKGHLYYLDAAGNVHEKMMKQYRDNKNRSTGLDGTKKKRVVKRKTTTKRKVAKKK